MYESLYAKIAIKANQLTCWYNWMRRFINQIIA